MKTLSPFVEMLENRKLLAGVTLLAHGFEGTPTTWSAATAAGIVERLGGASAASVYTLRIDDSTGSLAVASFSPDPGFGDYRNTSSSEAIIKLDYNAVSGPAFTTSEVALVLAEYLLLPRTSQQLPALAQLPLHLVGHGRGGSLVSELARTLGRRGVIVDQTTFLDASPITSYGDPSVDLWDNVTFADNYWRDDGDPNNAIFDGATISGAAEGNLNNSVGADPGTNAHESTAAYYVGTTDLDATDGGSAPINTNWYSSPARDATGYLFSRIGGGTRPAGGIGPLIDGSASRTSSGQAGAQFPNIFDLKAKGGSSFTVGTDFNISFRGSDRDDQASYEIYLDSNRNPYDGAGTQIASSVLTGTPDFFESSTTAGDLPVGKFVLAACIEDGDGQKRWFYGRTITFTPPPPVGTLTNGVLRIDGTSGADTIDATEASGQLIATLNQLSSNYNSADVTRIEIYGLDGNDQISIGGAIGGYVDAGGGNDRAFGGEGNDTLTGGAGKNTLFGSSGNDRLNGSGGRDSLLGEGGDDRLYGNGGDDTLDGGGNVDRLFGGDGNDSLFGASSNDKIYGELGNDTLFGGNGDDILDGGDGTDSAEDRSGDDRVSIEILL